VADLLERETPSGDGSEVDIGVGFSNFDGRQYEEFSNSRDSSLFTTDVVEKVSY
jgi:hypothetical protein